MKIPDVILEKTSGEGWSLTVGRFDAYFLPRGEMAGIFLIKLNEISLPMALINQWQRQLSSGEYVNNLAVVVMNTSWWLAQYIEDDASVEHDIHLQWQLVECMYAIARSPSRMDAQ